MKYPIPKETIQQNIIVLGKTGAGKSSAARSIVEPMLEDRIPLCILDPKGDWWGIKLSGDGKRPGYPLVVFGGKHADVPINPHSGSQVAELFATGNRPCLIDMRGWMPGERSEFFIDFASTVYQKNVGRRWLVMDEVHNFAPKGKVMDPQAGKCLHWANKLASEGRGLGVNLIGLSQRPQKVHNDFLTSCETLIALRVLHASDRGAYKDWIDGCGDPEKGKAMLAKIANLKRGTGFVWSPEIEFGPDLVTFPMFKTYDSFKPQEAGELAKLSGWAEVDLDEVRAKLAVVVKEAAENDPKALKAKIAELEKRLKQAPAAAPAIDEATLRERAAEAWSEGFALAKREQASEDRTSLCNRIDNVTREIAGKLADLATDLRFQRDSGQGIVPPKISPPLGPPPKRPVVQRQRPAAGPRSSAAAVTLPKGEAATLAACIQFPDGLRREQLTVLTGYKRSSRDAYVQRLREKGLVVADGDRVVATDAGIDAMPDAEPLPTGEALQEYWLQRLPEGERKVLSVLIDSYPGAVQRSDIDAQTGYQRSSRDAYLQRLKAKQLISEPSRGEVMAAGQLFE